MRRWVIGLLLLVAARADADEIPVIGRPADLPFSDASAGFARVGGDLVCPFRLSVSATPTTLEAEAPLTFTVTIRARGLVRQPPVRIDLRELPSIVRSFHVVDFIDGRKTQLAPQTWRWTYRLKPRRAGIDEIPRLPFVFFNPDVRPSDKGFQVIWTDAIRLTVAPQELDERRLDLAPTVAALTTGPAVLADRSPWPGPSAPLLVVVVAAPPLLGLLWYVVWKRAYPDAARRATQRRSRAARRALAALASADRLDGKAKAEAIATTVVAYLRERFDLGINEPTPDEAADWLRRHGKDGDAARRLLLACAAARFGDAASPGVEDARAFITTTEEPPRS